MNKESIDAIVDDTFERLDSLQKAYQAQLDHIRKMQRPELIELQEWCLANLPEELLVLYKLRFQGGSGNGK